MRLFLSVFLLFATCLFAEEEIIVHLATQNALAPLCLDPIDAAHSDFPKSYLEKLERVLAFDLNHNGKTEVTRTAKSAAYLVKTRIVGKELQLTAISVALKKTKGIEGIQLSGNLSDDRRKIHLVSDAITNTFFRTEGIASTRILYTLRHKKKESSSDGWVTEVWESDYDGANAKRIVSDGHLVVTPAYVPPKTGCRTHAFFYVSYLLGQPKLYLSSTESQGSKRVTYTPGNQLMPALAPSRDCIAYISDALGNPDLFIQAFDPSVGTVGKPRCLYTSSMGAQGSPSFSPDGKKLAFVSNKDGTPRIYVMTIPPMGKGTPILISKQNRENTSPAWSPDGTKLAYSSQVDGVRQIWIYDFKTQKEWQLTSGLTHKENPSWAPNSLHLVFNSSSQDNCDLFIANLNQKSVTKISRSSGEKRFPAWEVKT